MSYCVIIIGIHTGQDIDGLALLDMVKDLSEFKEVLPKAGDRLAIKRLVERLQKAEKVLCSLSHVRGENALNHKKNSPSLCYMQ